MAASSERKDGMPDVNTVLQQIRETTRAPEFQPVLADLLVELCRVDTTPSPDVATMAAAEQAVFAIIERELAAIPLPDARPERRAINPEIAGHPAFSLLHYTKTPARPEGLTAEQAYAGRGNLLYIVPGADPEQAGHGLALNAHVDVVHPYFPPRQEKSTVYGRGTCDDKGQVVAILAALKLAAAVLSRSGRRLPRNLLAMFVIEEEPGGNGSLSLAMDRELKQLYDSMLVMEVAGNRIHPANRGAVWYRADLQAPPDKVLELAAFVIGELEHEGRAIKAESRHPLFPQRPVQTCHGILGPYGEHPSRICAEVAFTIDFDRAPDNDLEQLVRDCLDAALTEYCGLYGDKTQVRAPDTGQPKVAKHLDLERQTTGFLVQIHGASGHMGSILGNDGAITKMAVLIRALVRSRTKIEDRAGHAFVLEVAGSDGAGTIPLEGGQGFVPTHPIAEIMARLRAAAAGGTAAFGHRNPQISSGQTEVRVSYDKLHNAAFDGDPDSAAMRCATAAAKACGLWRDEPVIGWHVSCDARLFATEYPDLPVLTSGSGHLAHAHSDVEQLDLDELTASIEFLTLFLLDQTGALG